MGGTGGFGMTVLLHGVDSVAVGAAEGDIDGGMGVVDVVDWLRRAQNAPRERNPYLGRHAAEHQPL